MRRLVLFLLVSCSMLMAQTWHRPYDQPEDQNYLRGYLEQSFKSVLSECGVPSFKKAKYDKHGLELPDDGSTADLSAIPLFLQNGTLQFFDTKVPGPFKVPPAAVFAYLYKQSETVGYPNFDESQMLQADYVQDPLGMLPSWTTKVFYNQSCSSVVSAAASVSTGISLPVATLKAGLQADYSGKSKTVLSLHEGTFVSPLNAYLDSPNSSDQLLGKFVL
jgi:hypothetical protein